MASSTERPLGIIEAISAVRDQCPNAAVRSYAESALEIIKREGASAMRPQAHLVLSTSAGWRGARADQVRRTLQQFLAQTLPPATQ